MSLAARPLGNARVRNLEEILAACALLEATRPTAVNLGWALQRMRRRARAVTSAAELHAALVAEADAIWAEDRAMCQRIGEAGLSLVPDGATVLTHCNAGALATGGIGTALAPDLPGPRRRPAGGRGCRRDPSPAAGKSSHRLGADPGRHTHDDHQRQHGGEPLRLGDIHCVMVGADRIARNGDVANKIGTYGVALLARAHAIPFYVAAPASTFDRDTASGAADHH